MTDDDKPITRQAIAAKERSGKLTVTGKLKVALDEMLFKGSCRADAATFAGMTDHGLREAMKKPHVKAYYSSGLEILRTSERARNIFALAKVRDSSDNGMAIVSAAKALEQLADAAPPAGVGDRNRPGVVITIIQQAPRDSSEPGAVIDVSPELIEPER